TKVHTRISGRFRTRFASRMYRRHWNIPVRPGKSNGQAGHRSSLEFALSCTHRITGPLLPGRALHPLENGRHGCNPGGSADDCSGVDEQVEVRALVARTRLFSQSEFNCSEAVNIHSWPSLKSAI